MSIHAKAPRNWEVEEDARTLVRAQAILGDAQRLQRAKGELARIAEERQKEVAAAKTVLRKARSSGRVAKRRTGKGKGR